MNPQPAALRLVEPIPSSTRTRPNGVVRARVTVRVHRDVSGEVWSDVSVEKFPATR
jgi:hypothetical protein